MEQKLKIRDRIQRRIEKSAWTLSGLKAYERIRVELVIFAFIFICGIFYTGYGVIFNQWIRTISGALIMLTSFFTFIGKSVRFRRLYMINRMKEGTINGM